MFDFLPQFFQLIPILCVMVIYELGLREKYPAPSNIKYFPKIWGNCLGVFQDMFPMLF